MEFPALVFMLFILLGGHAIADYPLQGDFLAVGKGARAAPHFGVPWWHCLTAHAMIHGAFVAFLTGSLTLGLVEFVLHWIIDDLKCRKITGINADQALHICCKVAYVVVMAVAGYAPCWLEGAP